MSTAESIVPARRIRSIAVNVETDLPAPINAHMAHLGLEIMWSIIKFWYGRRSDSFNMIQRIFFMLSDCLASGSMSSYNTGIFA